MKNISGTLNFTKINKAGKTYLKIVIPDNMGIIEYQVEMIQAGSIKGLIKPDVINENQKECIYYDITGYKTMYEYLSEKLLNADEIKNMIYTMVMVIINAKEYLLSEKSFLYNIKNVYCSIDIKESYFIYVPVDFSNKQMGFKELAVDLCTKYLDIQSLEGEAVMKKIMLLSRDKNTAIDEYKEIGILSKKKNLDLDYYKYEKKNKEKRNFKEFICADKKKMLIFAGIQPILIFAAAFTVIYFKNHNQNISASLITGILIACAGLDLLFGIKLGYFNEFIQKGKNEIFSINDLFDFKKNNNNEESSTINKINFNTIDNNKEFELCKNENTVLLNSNRPKKKLIFNTLENKENLQFEIDKDEFILGRQGGNAHFKSKNAAIGRMHAKIIYKDKQYYIMDENSKNGTYLNDEKIYPGKIIKIRNNDKIKLANQVFTVSEY